MQDLRSILKERKSIGYYLYANWIFSSLLEKLLLSIFIGLAWWKIAELVIKFLF